MPIRREVYREFEPSHIFESTDALLESTIPSWGRVGVLGPGLSPAEDPTLAKICHLVYPEGTVVIIDPQKSGAQDPSESPAVGLGDADLHTLALSIFARRGTQLVLPEHLVGGNLLHMKDPSDLGYTSLYDHGTLSFIQQLTHITRTFDPHLPRKTFAKAFDALDQGGSFILQTFVQKPDDLTESQLFGSPIAPQLRKVGFTVEEFGILDDAVTFSAPPDLFSTDHETYPEEEALLMHIEHKMYVSRGVARFMDIAYPCNRVFIATKP